MATIDVANRQIHAKLVYYGPGLSGKTTNILNLYERMLPDFRGPLRVIETELERTLFFDFTSIEPVHLGGWDIRFHVYSVPGQDGYERTRRAVLSGTDGVVFVADSGTEQREANLLFLEEMVENLSTFGRSLDQFPIVFQFNKMDLEDAMTHEELSADLNSIQAPEIDAIALHGRGVKETFQELMRKVTRTL